MSIDPKPRASTREVMRDAALRAVENADQSVFDYLRQTEGALHVQGVFAPSSYDTDLTMDGTAQGVALATGARKLRVINRGATTEDIRFAFGTSEERRAAWPGTRARILSALTASLSPRGISQLGLFRAR